jgi:hypothetical protein
MKPKEFSWDEAQQVTVKNPTNEDFKFKAHNKDYMVKAGQTVKMAGFIGWRYVYSLACKMAQDANDFIHWNEDGFRQKYYDKLIVAVDGVVQEVVVEDTVPEFEEVPDEPSDNEAAEKPKRTRKPRNTVV